MLSLTRARARGCERETRQGRIYRYTRACVTIYILGLSDESLLVEAHHGGAHARRRLGRERGERIAHGLREDGQHGCRKAGSQDAMWMRPRTGMQVPADKFSRPCSLASPSRTCAIHVAVPDNLARIRSAACPLSSASSCAVSGLALHRQLPPSPRPVKAADAAARHPALHCELG